MKIAVVFLSLVAATCSAATLTINKAGGGAAAIAIANGPSTVDSRTGDVTVTPVANAGTPGDGWCPTGPTVAPTMTSPSVYLALPNGVRYRIPLASASNPSWSPGFGNWTISAKAAAGVPGDGWCPTITMPAPAFTTSLIGQPASISAGQQTMLTWATANATTCSTSGTTLPSGVTSVSGWMSTMATSSIGTVLTLPTAGTYVFRLTCTGAGGSVASSASVSVSGSGGGGTSCTGTHLPPSNRTRQTTMAIDTTDLWAASNTDWPRNSVVDTTMWNPAPPGQLDANGVNRSFMGRFGGNPGDTGTLEVSSSKYVAFQIDTTGQSNKYGAINWEQPGASGAPLLITISPCPGDFSPASAQCKSDGTAASGMGWTTGQTPSNYCKLTPGTTYYLNVVFGSPSSPGTSTCSFAKCRWLFSSSCQGGCTP